MATPFTLFFLVQVKVLQFHVTQPWIAFADKNQQLTIWDWSTDQVRTPALQVGSSWPVCVRLAEITASRLASTEDVEGASCCFQKLV